ncbi:MAG: alpha/beta hydrolase [Rhodocyclaceae bacterium]|nr:alpha/beta hydrolase [Rhodocyclaceae bacterium]
MSQAATALPSYARLIDDRRAPFIRALLNLILRWLIKRAMKPDADVFKLRAMQIRLDQKYAHPDPAARVTQVDCDGVKATWIDLPESRPERVIFYLHGGAWMFHFPRTYAAMMARWARHLNARVLLVDYRLAPEHRYPAGADDCETAYRWLLAQGVDSKNIVIGGDSAGGNLTLATLHRLKVADQRLPACAVAISPFVDFTLSSASLVSNESIDPMFTLEAMLGLRPHYLNPEQLLNIDASPVFADFTGLPPIFFQASNTEMLCDESVRAAARAHQDGVVVELELWQNLPHVFQALAKLPQADAALKSITRFVQTHTGWVA